MTKAPERIWAQYSAPGWRGIRGLFIAAKPEDGYAEFVRTDLSNALIGAAYEAAAAEIRKLDNGKSDREWLNYNLAVQRALGKIRALTPADARAALERVARPRWYRMDDAENPPPKSDPKTMRAVSILGWTPDKTAYTGGDWRVIWWEPLIKNGCWWSDLDIEAHPTHWMPLPQPPEDEG